MKIFNRFMAGSLLLVLMIVSAYSQYGNNDKNGVDGKFENHYYRAGVTPVDPYTGNLHTEIKDLETWGTVGDMPLAWIRYGNSRNGNYPALYGTAHNWNGSYMFFMADAGANGQGRAQIVIHYPEGGENVFTQDSADANLWLPLPGVGKRLFRDANNFYLQVANGFRYRFEKLAGASGDYYQLQDFKDSRQNLYALSYENRRLVKITEPAGRFLEISYTNVGGMAVINKVAASDGRSVLYNYSAANGWVYLTGAIYGDGTEAAYTYSQNDAAARPSLSHAIDPRSIGRAVNMKYTYNIDAGTEGFIREQRNGLNDSLMVTLSTDTATRTLCYRNGRIQVYEMPKSKAGLVTLYTDGLGRQTEYKYGQGGNGFLLNETNALNRVTTYNLRTVYGNLLKVTYPDGTKEGWTRDDLDLILSHTDELGRTTAYTRDANHNITRIDFADGTHELFEYNGFGQVTKHTRKNGGIELSEYDSRGLLTRFTDALANAAQYGYDNAGRLTAVTDARNNTVRYEYDERGLTIKHINADNSFKAYGYDTYGNRTISVNELGDSTTFIFDEFKRIMTQTAPLGRGVEYSYELPGNISGSAHDQKKPTTFIMASGKFTVIEYNVEWEKIKITKGTGSPQEATTEYQYDAAGNMVAIIDPNGNEWVYEYDLKDRRISAADPLSNTTKWVYDAAGNVLQVIRPDNGTTTNKYDNMNRLTRTVDPKGQVTKFGYDAEGNTVLLSDPKNNATTFDFDLLNRQTKMIYPYGTAEINTYDAVSNLKTYTNRNGAVRTYSYDNRNRDTASVWSDNTSPVRKTYDSAGRLRSIVNNISTVTYVYNAAGELTGEKQKIKGMPAKTINYKSNGDGLRDTLIYPDGTVVTYDYNSRNLLAAIAVDGVEPLVRYAYDLNGNRISKDLENGTKTVYDYDAANRLQLVNNRNTAGSFARFDYGYDNVNRRTYVQRNNGKGDVYAYDAIDQVTGVQYEATDPDSAATNPQRKVSYTWDAAGNRDTVTDNGNMETYTANKLNQYTKVADSTLKYDANGNLRKYNGWTYTYDAQNRLVSAKNGSVSARFDYDAFNRCVKRTINGVSTFLYYDDWNLIEERSSSDMQLAKYIHGARIDEILKRVAPGINIYSHHDALGNVITLTDSTGAIKENYTYDVFGKPTIKNEAGTVISYSAFGNRFMYTGREFIKEIGLYDYRNRIFHQALGRFVQTDPIQFASLDYNLYRYVFNSAVNASDPSGEILLGTLVKIAIAAVIIGGGIYLLNKGMDGAFKYADPDAAAKAKAAADAKAKADAEAKAKADAEAKEKADKKKEEEDEATKTSSNADDGCGAGIA